LQLRGRKWHKANKRNAYTNLVRKPEVERHLEWLAVDGRIILK
jgi:hypothetical protein